MRAVPKIGRFQVRTFEFYGLDDFQVEDEFYWLCHGRLVDNCSEHSKRSGWTTPCDWLRVSRAGLYCLTHYL